MVALSSCHNKDLEFDDYDYQSVYFSYQYPVRTITLGDDIYDTSLDNAHQCKIFATTGGVNENENDVIINIEVDESLCDSLVFGAGGESVVPMPTNYYSLESDKIIIPAGSLSGGVLVQLTDAFFADTLSLTNKYVIPLVMKDVSDADTILSGQASVNNPRRCVPDDWSIASKDYVLYCVKYINPYEGSYLRRGKDVVTKDGVESTIVRHEEYVVSDEVFQITSLSFYDVLFPLGYQNESGEILDLNMILTFDDDQNCSVSTSYSSIQLNDSSRIYNITATGSGKFVENGEKNSWGDKDRNGLYLDYNFSYNIESVSQGVADVKTVSYATTDTLVARNRGVVSEYFDPQWK